MAINIKRNLKIFSGTRKIEASAGQDRGQDRAYDKVAKNIGQDMTGRMTRHDKREENT